MAIELRRHVFAAMSCRIELQAVADARDFARAASTVAAETRRIEAKFSRYRPESIVSRINQAAGLTSVPVDHETAGLLAFADYCHRASGGLFDVTSGALRRVWKQSGDSGAGTSQGVPGATELARICASIGWEKVQINTRQVDATGLAGADTTATVFLPSPGMEIDLGGLGKEYAADRAATVLRQQGIGTALLNFGGDLHACGPLPDGSPWQVGITHPRQPGQLLATVPLYQGGLATSGDYERCLLIDGVRYSHLFDPRSGMPVRGLASATVIADTCLVAGALASMALLQGDAGADFLGRSGAPFLAMDEAGRLWRGAGQVAAA